MPSHGCRLCAKTCFLNPICKPRLPAPLRRRRTSGKHKSGAVLICWECKGETKMDDDSKMSFFSLGLGIGAAMGVLFAPKSGSETRDFLLSKANEGTELAKRRAQELKDQAAVTIERGKSTVQRQKESLSAAVDAGRQAYRDTVNQPLPE